MEYYAGIDVSLECSSLCVVDGTGKIVREGKVPSEPEDLIRWLKSLGQETGSDWKQGRCRSGFLRRCEKRGWRSSF